MNHKKLNEVLVVGAGIMGAGIAQVAAQRSTPSRGAALRCN